jgi:glycerol-3-phosphate dehydrogenase
MLAPLRDEVFDLLILGGGITGAGIALDAVLRGFRVALIDKGDFASGTSSVSSKLIHGGLRYLEHGALGLVYEALAERRRLLHNAPHLVHPLRFVIPFYEGSRLARWQWRLGLTLYDLLAGRGNLHRSRSLDRRQCSRAFPELRTQGLRGGGAYFDAQMDDARVCIEVMRTAALQGACVANYVEAVAFERRAEPVLRPTSGRRAGQLSGVRAVDRLTGSEFSIRATQVVNATGPWVDAVCRLAGDTSGPHLRPTKGVHLIAPNRSGVSAALLLLHPADGRVFFVIPWPRPPDEAELTPGKILIGTTDTFGETDPDALRVTAEEIAYLIEGHNHYLQSRLRSEDILGSFSGLRPLIRAAPGEPSALSREFRLVEGPSGLLSVAGGKYTTYRHMAEVATDEIARRLGRRRGCRTRHLPLDGTPEGSWEEFVPAAVTLLKQEHNLSAEAARHLVFRYGRRAFDVAGYLRQAPELARPLVAGEPDLQVEILYQRDHEMAISAADHFVRRMRLGLFRPELLLLAALAPGLSE